MLEFENQEGWHKSQRYMEEGGETLFASCYLLSARCYPFSQNGQIHNISSTVDYHLSN